MKNNVYETKNFIITDLGEVNYEGSKTWLNYYRVHVKNIDCLDILFEFDCNNNIVCLSAYNQNNKSPNGQAITDFTYNIVDLIKNDVAEIVKFIYKHLQ